MRNIRVAFCVTVLLVGMAPLLAWAERAAGKDDSSTSSSDRIRVDKGIRVEFSIDPVGRAPGDVGPLREGDHADVRFRVTEDATGDPISPLEPAAWIDQEDVSRQELDCAQRIRRYVQSTLTFKATIDLNKFFILVLNEDPTINVIDPILGVTGYTQHYAIVDLKAPGEDWVTGPRESLLYVSMPGADAVAVVDLESFKLVKDLAAGDNPVRVAFQPDGRYLWVGNDTLEAESSGVTVIDTRSGKVAARIPTGPGHHELAFSDDSLVAYVTNSAAGTLSVIDTQRLEKMVDLPTGRNPVAVGFSALGQAAYVAHEGDGSIAVIGRQAREVVQRIPGEPGLVAFRFSPDGRWGFAANVKTNQVTVVDASSNAVARTIDVDQSPDRVTFTDTFAYVHHLGSPFVHLIQLDTLEGTESVAVQTIGFGSQPPGDGPKPAFADPVVPTGEWGTVVATNPVDKLMYYYMEGTVTPMGSYSAYGHVPRAVGVVDRSLRESEKGVYEAQVQIPAAGTYTAAFLLDAPWVDQCFLFTAEPDDMIQADRVASAPPRVEVIDPERRALAGREFSLRFEVTRDGGARAIGGLRDVQVLLARAPWNWQMRRTATPREDGSYEVLLRPDRAGPYYVFFGIPSLDFDMTQIPQHPLRAVRPGEVEGASDE